MGKRVLFLVRHGQYVSDEKHRQFGSLTALGRRQAARTGRRLVQLQFDAIYHSDLPRAVETAELIAGEFGTLPMHAMRSLRELMPPCVKRRGEPPRPRRELAALRKVSATLKRKFFSPPRGQRERLELIVAHGNLIRYLVRLALGEPVEHWLHWATHNCGITVITIRDKNPNYLTSYNDIGHLPLTMQTMT